MDYFRLFRILQKGDKSFFEVSVDEQKDFLLTLEEPKDDFDRSYNQYLCQNYFVPRFKRIFLNLLFFLFPPLILIIFLIKGVFVKKKTKVNAIASLKLNTQILPNDLLQEFEVDDSIWGLSKSLRLNDLPFIIRLFKKWPLSPVFVSKCLVKITVYSDMIRKYSPNALLSHCEFSFTSSILTAYCHYYGVEHINTMHGEKLFYIRDSFFHFDRCYVWDKYYADLFCRMRAEPSQFRIFIPDSFKIDCVKYYNKKLYADYKYYLAIYDEKEISDIVRIMKQLMNKGASVLFRPHPRYSDLSLLKKYVDENLIENPLKVSIQESIANCKYAVGSYTTVLNQAYYSGKTVILDDIAFVCQYEQLKNLSYFLSSKDTVTLSNHVSNE